MTFKGAVSLGVFWDGEKPQNFCRDIVVDFRCPIYLAKFEIIFHEPPNFPEIAGPNRSFSPTLMDEFSW